MSLSKSPPAMSTRQRRQAKRLERMAYQQHGVLRQIERGLKSDSLVLPGIPTNTVELHEFYSRPDSSQGMNFTSVYTLRYNLDTGEWWLIRIRRFKKGEVTSGSNSREKRFWQTLRFIPSESLAEVTLQWGPAAY